jgi:hypothetical protein
MRIWRMGEGQNPGLRTLYSYDRTEDRPAAALKPTADQPAMAIVSAITIGLRRSRHNAWLALYSAAMGIRAADIKGFAA